MKKVVADIQPRINLIGQTLREAGLPQLPAEEVQAMQEGSREGSENVKARIENNNIGLKVLQQPPEVRDKVGTLVVSNIHTLHIGMAVVNSTRPVLPISRRSWRMRENELRMQRRWKRLIPSTIAMEMMMMMIHLRWITEQLSFIRF